MGKQHLSRDTHSIAYLYECLEKLAEEINDGRIKRKHIKDVLKDECGVVFGDLYDFCTRDDDRRDHCG